MFTFLHFRFDMLAGKDLLVGAPLGPAHRPGVADFPAYMLNTSLKCGWHTSPGNHSCADHVLDFRACLRSFHRLINGIVYTTTRKRLTRFWVFLPIHTHPFPVRLLDRFRLFVHLSLHSHIPRQGRNVPYTEC